MAEFNKDLLTQRMSIHVSQGGGKHLYGYNVFYDGEPTGITIAKASRKGRVLSSRARLGDDEIDLISSPIDMIEAWFAVKCCGEPSDG